MDSKISVFWQLKLDLNKSPASKKLTEQLSAGTSSFAFGDGRRLHGPPQEAVSWKCRERSEQQKRLVGD